MAAGIGTLFKEYAFFAFLPLGLYLLYKQWRTPGRFILSLLPLALSLVPLLLVHVGVYFGTGYSYLDWYGMNSRTFAFTDWGWNAMRSFLVVLSFMLLVAVLGGFAFWQEMRKHADPKRIFFVLSLILPAAAVFLWPIITERLVFLIVPLAALLTAYAVKANERHWPWFAFVWLLYVIVALKTDGLILNALYAL